MHTFWQSSCIGRAWLGQPWTRNPYFLPWAVLLCLRLQCMSLLLFNSLSNHVGGGQSNAQLSLACVFIVFLHDVVCLEFLFVNLAIVFVQKMSSVNGISTPPPHRPFRMSITTSLEAFTPVVASEMAWNVGKEVEYYYNSIRQNMPIELKLTPIMAGRQYSSVGIGLKPGPSPKLCRAWILWWKRPDSPESTLFWGRLWML